MRFYTREFETFIKDKFPKVKLRSSITHTLSKWSRFVPHCLESRRCAMQQLDEQVLISIDFEPDNYPRKIPFGKWENLLCCWSCRLQSVRFAPTRRILGLSGFCFSTCFAYSCKAAAAPPSFKAMLVWSKKLYIYWQMTSWSLEMLLTTRYHSSSRNVKKGAQLSSEEP